METTKPGGKYPEQGVTASQTSWQGKWFKSLVLSQSTSLSYSGGAQTLLMPAAKRGDRLKLSSSGSKLLCLELATKLSWPVWLVQHTLHGFHENGSSCLDKMGRLMQVLWVLGQHSLMPVTLLPWKSHPSSHCWKMPRVPKKQQWERATAVLRGNVKGLASTQAVFSQFFVNW